MIEQNKILIDVESVANYENRIKWGDFFHPFYSSAIFIVNFCLCFYFGFYFYGLCFLSLTITSLIVHQKRFNDHYFFNVWDKISIYLVAIVGFFVFFGKCQRCYCFRDFIFATVIVFTFCATVFLYYYGYCTEKYCFCREHANFWHFIMHCVGSFGHILILLL